MKEVSQTRELAFLYPSHWPFQMKCSREMSEGSMRRGVSQAREPRQPDHSVKSLLPCIGKMAESDG